MNGRKLLTARRKPRHRRVKPAVNAASQRRRVKGTHRPRTDFAGGPINASATPKTCHATAVDLGHAPTRLYAERRHFKD